MADPSGGGPTEVLAIALWCLDQSDGAVTETSEKKAARLLALPEFRQFLALVAPAQRGPTPTDKAALIADLERRIKELVEHEVGDRAVSHWLVSRIHEVVSSVLAALRERGSPEPDLHLALRNVHGIAMRVKRHGWRDEDVDHLLRFCAEVGIESSILRGTPDAPAGEAPRGIYVASRTRHASKWRGLRDSGFPIVSSWIDEAGSGQTDDYSDLMRRCISEAAGAAAMIVYAEGDDVLGWKGVWFEMGAACASGVSVYFAGTHDFPSALRHPSVLCCETLEDAMALALADERRARAALRATDHQETTK